MIGRPIKRRHQPISLLPSVWEKTAGGIILHNPKVPAGYVKERLERAKAQNDWDRDAGRTGLLVPAPVLVNSQYADPFEHVLNCYAVVLGWLAVVGLLLIAFHSLPH